MGVYFLPINLNMNRLDKRRRVIDGNFTRGCDPEYFRSHCTGNESSATNPCSGGAQGAQEDGTKPVPSNEKACSWIAKQAMTKKELDNACRIDSMDSADADYYMTDERGGTDPCIYRTDESTWKQVAKDTANFSITGSKPFTFGNINAYVGFGNLLTPERYGYRRVTFDQSNMEKCCLGAGTFQQGGFRPLGASCTTVDDCLGSTWDDDYVDAECWSSTGKKKGGICRQNPKNHKLSASKALWNWQPNPNNQWTVDPSTHPYVCDTVWTPGIPVKEKTDERAESKDNLWANSCGNVVVTGAKPFCMQNFKWEMSHLTNTGLEEVGRIRWDVWPDESRVPFPSSYVKGLVKTPKKPCDSTTVKQPGCPCDQTPGSGSRCKVDFSFQYCHRPTYKEDIEWCAKNCASFNITLNCGLFSRPGCGEPKSDTNPNGYPVSPDDVAKFTEENVTMCKTMRGDATTLASPSTPTGPYDKEVHSRLNDATYCRNWMLGNYANGTANPDFRQNICEKHPAVLSNGAKTGLVDLCNVRQTSACMKGQDRVTPMTHCPGWKQDNAFGEFCRNVANAYPVQADEAKNKYCDENPLDETCDCLKAGVVGTRQTDCQGSGSVPKNVGDRKAFCAQTSGTAKTSNAITQLLAKNRVVWYNFCQPTGANAEYTLKPSYVWSTDKTRCTEDAKDKPPGTCDYPSTCQKMEQPDHICANIISIAGQNCVATGDGTCNVFKNIHMSNRCGELANDRKECLKTPGNKYVSRSRVVYDDNTHKTVPCSDDKACTSYKANGQTARCDINTEQCIFQDFVCVQPNHCEANVTCPKGKVLKTGAIGNTTDECCVAPCESSLCPKGTTTKTTAVCNGTTCTTNDVAKCCTSNQTCETYKCPDGFEKTNVHSHCSSLKCDSSDQSTCCVAKKLCPSSCGTDEKPTGKKFCDSVEGCRPDECCVHKLACPPKCPSHHVRTDSKYCKDETKCEDSCCEKEPFTCSIPLINIVPLAQGKCDRPFTFVNIFKI